MAKAQPAAKTAKTAAKANVTNYVEPGPRGFRFGYAYIESVIEGEGIAAKEANKKKLVAFAKEIGVEGVTMKSDIAEAMKAMKAAAKKYIKQNFEAPTVH